MRWPWQNRDADDASADLETRSSYSDAVVAAILAQARGVTAQPTTTAALEACAGLVGRSFAGARIENAPDIIGDALTPSLMCMVGRALIRYGEIVLVPDVSDAGQLVLLPASSHTVTGTSDAWEYQVTLAGPSTTTTIKLPADGVCHFRYACDAARPWRGIGPLGVASLAGRLSAEVVKMLADEAASARGYVLAFPKDGADETLTQLSTDLSSAQGGLTLVESTSGNWSTDDSRSSGPRQDWTVKRIGADPPASMISLAEHSSNEIYAACGLSGLFTAGGESASREDFRRALVSTIAPIGKLVEQELRFKLEVPDLTLSWAELRASDLAGRARAFQSMVGGGMDVAKAAQLAGLLVEDDN